MPENKDAPEEKKKYRVIDRRPNYDDDLPAAGAQDADSGNRPREPEPEQSPAPGSGAGTQPAAPSDPGPEDMDQRKVQIEDLVALILNLLRDQAVVSLGMHFTAGPASSPNAPEAEKAAALYRAVAAQYPDIVQSFIPDEYRQQPPPPSDLVSTLAMAINLVQSHALIQMGLIADPGSGLVVKDLPQAKKTIDLLGVIIDTFKPHLPGDAVKNIQNTLSDLRVNYVNQVNTT